MKNNKAHILTASAGSGKTYSLAREYIYNTLRPQPEEELRGFNPYVYRTILAVTFTNKATEEMKSRILSQINNLATGNKCEFLDDLKAMTGLTKESLQERAMQVRSAILHDYSRFAVLTNDTFFQRIVRAFVKELGIDINYAIELDSGPIIEKSAETLISNIDSNPELQKWLLELADDNIDDGQKWDIKESILALKNELFKESTKEAIESIDREQIKDMVERYLEITDKEIDSIKAVAKKALDLMRENGIGHEVYSSKFTIYFDNIVKLNQAITDSSKIANTNAKKHTNDDTINWVSKDKRKHTPQVAFDLVADLQPLLRECIEKQPRLEYLLNSKALLSKHYRSYAMLGDLYNTAKLLCKEQNTMLLSETKHTISTFVTEEDAPFIYEKVGNHFEHFMIDEFQDTSLKEWDNFRPLLLNAIAQSADIAVLIVGDIKQSIYRWRGSNWNILSSVAPTDLKRGDTPILEDKLEYNFRSLPAVIDFNNDTMVAAAEKVNNLLNSTLDRALEDEDISKACHDELYNAIETAYNDKSVVQKKHPNREYKVDGFVKVSAHYTAEPDIIGCIRQLVHEKGYLPSDITILVRKQKEANKIAELLLQAGAEDESMRFGVMTQEALKLNSSIVVQFIIAVMKYAVDRNDKVSLAIYKHILHNNLYHTITDEEIAFFDNIRSYSAEVAFEKILIQFVHLFEGQGAYIDALHENIISFCSTKVADVMMFIKWWDEKGDKKSITIDKDPNCIEIMTIHKSKGLENKVIIIPYCNWPFIPENTLTPTIWTNPSDREVFNSETTFPIEAFGSAKHSIFAEGYYQEYIYSHIDAINLLYVALTRPREQLHVFFPVVKPNKDGIFNNKSNVGQMLFSIFDMQTEYKKVNDGEPLPDPICREFGKFEGPEKTSSKDEGTISITETAVSDYKMKLKLSSRKYSEALESGTISAKDEGILLHGIMERAHTFEDINSSIEALVVDGILSETSAATLTERLNEAMSNPTVASWFSPKWETIHTEEGIIAREKGTLRPDRVLISGDKAIVIDYKFGEINNSYRKKVSKYCELLEQMGYKDVKGYLWYVRQGVIDDKCYEK